MPRLTAPRVREENHKEYSDTALAGFGIRVLPSGRKRFFLHTRTAASTLGRSLTIRRYDGG